MSDDKGHTSIIIRRPYEEPGEFKRTSRRTVERPLWNYVHDYIQRALTKFN